MFNLKQIKKDKQEEFDKNFGFRRVNPMKIVSIKQFQSALIDDVVRKVLREIQEDMGNKSFDGSNSWGESSFQVVLLEDLDIKINNILNVKQWRKNKSTNKI